MILLKTILRLAASSALALACAAAPAAPVTLSLQGTVTGYDYIDLSSGLPVGAAVNLTLNFNETFSDGSYDFSDNLGPVSGQMSVGGANYVFDDVVPFSYQGGFGGFALGWVMPRFTGTGPVLDGGDFFGLFAQITPGLTLADDLRLGYGFTTRYPDGLTVTNYGYAHIRADSYSFTPTVQVPTPATLPLVRAALLAVGLVRSRKA